MLLPGNGKKEIRKTTGKTARPYPCHMMGKTTGSGEDQEAGRSERLGAGEAVEHSGHGGGILVGGGEKLHAGVVGGAFPVGV